YRSPGLRSAYSRHSAGACHWARRRRDPVADDDGGAVSAPCHILAPALCPQCAGRTFAAAEAPVVARAALAEIAGMGVLANQVDQAGAAEPERQPPGRGLVQPHQWRVQLEALRHAEIERIVERADGLVAAIRIAGIVGLAHAADDVRNPAAIGERGGEGQEDQIAPGYEGVGQSVFTHPDR